jgi:poly(glycerol-phosphate) alpha-glucosyltransferase
MRKELPLVIAPHGMLDPWALAQSRWKKRLVWHLWERRALEGAGCLQALTVAEADAIRACGLSTPVAVIPNGVSLPDPAGPLPEPPWKNEVAAGEQVLLFLGRFHPKKGLSPLLQAWRTVVTEARVHGWWLALVGFGDEGALAARVSSEGIGRCLVLGPCFGDHKAACLRQASAFVLPSYSEGMPMAALEAMSWGLPCLLSPACHLPEAFRSGAAFAITVDLDGIALGLRSLFSASATSLSVMGERGRELVEQRFSWTRVATMTGELYQWIGGEGPLPVFVQAATTRSVP